ncbi:hypothetical protein ACM66B_003874 [Microbotryomycetes sp. NB124-2]
MIVRRLARALRFGKERFYVGSDLEGNSFYEWPSPQDPSDWRHAKRTVEYAEARPLSEYQFVSIPVQWSAWMRRTRKLPPTMDELRTDAARQARLADNVEQLRLAYVEEKQRLRGERDDLLASPKVQQAQIGTPDVAEAAEEAVAPAPAATNARTNGDNLGDERVAKRAREERERERQLLKQKKEDFARAHPTFGVNKGNPSDTFQPEAWSSSTAKPKPRR